MFAMPSLPGIQINLFIYSIVWYIIYVNETLPFNDSTIGRVDTANQFMLLCSCYHFILFSDLVEEIEINYALGWSLIITFGVVVVFNVGIVFVVAAKTAISFLRLKYVRRKAHRNHEAQLL